MAQVRGIGGIFFKSKDPKALYAWYQQHLGITAKPGEGAVFPWQQLDGTGQNEITVWSIFPAASEYFRDPDRTFMLNYIVDDLDSTLNELRAVGVEVDPHVERYEYGDFGWITDPDGNRIELWQPKPR